MDLVLRFFSFCFCFCFSACHRSDGERTTLPNGRGARARQSGISRSKGRKRRAEPSRVCCLRTTG